MLGSGDMAVGNKTIESVPLELTAEYRERINVRWDRGGDNSEGGVKSVAILNIKEDITKKTFQQDPNIHGHLREEHSRSRNH